MKNFTNTLETLKNAKVTAATYNKVLESAQVVMENRAIEFIKTKSIQPQTYEQMVICSLCDLMSMNIQRPASMRNTMAGLIESAKNIANYKLGK